MGVECGCPGASTPGQPCSANLAGADCYTCAVRDDDDGSTVREPVTVGLVVADAVDSDPHPVAVVALGPGLDNEDLVELGMTHRSSGLNGDHIADRLTKELPDDHRDRAGVVDRLVCGSGGRRRRDTGTRHDQDGHDAHDEATNHVHLPSSEIHYPIPLVSIRR